MVIFLCYVSSPEGIRSLWFPCRPFHLSPSFSDQIDASGSLTTSWNVAAASSTSCHTIPAKRITFRSWTVARWNKTLAGRWLKGGFFGFWLRVKAGQVFCEFEFSVLKGETIYETIYETIINYLRRHFKKSHVWSWWSIFDVVFSVVVGNQLKLVAKPPSSSSISLTVGRWEDEPNWLQFPCIVVWLNCQEWLSALFPK